MHPRPKILIVTGDSTTAEIAAAVLREANHAVDVAVGGAARSALGEGVPRIDLMLIEPIVPGADALELIALARQRSIPVLLMSARTADGAAHEALLLGATDGVRKPLGLEDLLRRVHRALDSPR